ncbi:MAG: PH domain-containing protein [Acidobacteriota bacterium]
MDDTPVKPTSAPNFPEPPSDDGPPAPPIAPIPMSAPASTLGPLPTPSPAAAPSGHGPVAAAAPAPSSAPANPDSSSSGPSIADPSIAGPSIAEPSIAEPSSSAPARPAAARPGVDHALDPRSISAHRLRLFITTGLLAGLLLLIVIGVLAAEGLVLWAPAVWLLVVTLLLARAWWWPGVRYRHISYRIDDRSLVIRRGVWWRSVAWVPRSRVQHTDVTQGPVERHFGLGTLIVHTAGTQFAAVPLSGLAHETASAIRDLLIEETSADDAV